jgi:hypothetical protein
MSGTLGSSANGPGVLASGAAMSVPGTGTTTAGPSGRAQKMGPCRLSHPIFLQMGGQCRWGIESF